MADASKYKEELGRVQQQLGQLHAANSALKSQIKAAKQRQEEAAHAREDIMNAQVTLALGPAVCACVLQGRVGQPEKAKASVAAQVCKLCGLWLCCKA